MPDNAKPIRTGQEDLDLSCNELATRQSRIKQRIAELEVGARAQRRKDAMTDGLFTLGSAVLTGVGARGGISGLRTAAAAQAGLDAVIAGEHGYGQLSNVTDTIALAQRHGQLQRATAEKGC